MTRMEAEQVACIKSRNDRQNNYIAKANDDGSWRVDAIPVHRHIGPIKGR